jgi:hypothetical protein
MVYKDRSYEADVVTNSSYPEYCYAGERTKRSEDDRRFAASVVLNGRSFYEFEFACINMRNCYSFHILICI